MYHSRYNKRRGTILVLTAIMMIALMAMLALALDIGYIFVARNQMQRTADSAALAATWELIDPNGLGGPNEWAVLEGNARDTASEFAGYNPVLSQNAALASADIDVGYFADPTDPASALMTDNGSRPNAVRVRVRRTADQNGEVPLFFARVLGLDQVGLETQATATLITSVGGFRTPPNGGNVDLLPFALDQDTWNDLLAGIGTDDWTWDVETQQVSAGSDGILEVNLYPQGTGSPGNRGTVDIGSNNNSTADLSRQILYGVSPNDLAWHGGSLEFDANGELDLNGDTGISAGVKDELETIKGDPRVIPIFTTVTGPGNNAQYTIVAFVGIRIMEVKLTGKMSSKRVIVQPANVVVRGGVASSGSSSSYFVYSPVWLSR